MSTIRIIDYGVGNLHSALKAFKRFCDNVLLTDDPEELKKADKLVLPGVGSFEAGMQGLHVRGLIPVVQDFATSGKPMLGICLGAQLMLSKGFEFGEFEGLNIIGGDVIPFPQLKGEKVPHMGWNALHPAAEWKGTPLDGLSEGAEAYFVHSFIFKPKDQTDILATTTYGGCTFPSVLQKGAITGCQFHPEKSASTGMHIIEKFVRRA